MARLGDVFTITSGGTPDKNQAIYYENGTIPWIKTGDLKDKYVPNDVERISLEGLKHSSAKLFPAGTVLVAMYGATIGACSILNYEAATNQACAAFLPNSSILPAYLFYFLSSRKEQFIQDGVGGAQPNISAGYLKKVSFDMRKLDDQTRVVMHLDKICNLISLRKQQLVKLDELVKARFVEMFGDQYNNDKRWPIAKLGSLFKISSSKRIYQSEQVPTGVPFYRISDLVEKITTGTTNAELFISIEAYDNLKKNGLVPRADDILVTSRGTLGQCYVVTEQDKFYFQDGMISWLSDRSENVVTAYIAQLFLMEGFRKQIDDVPTGTTVNYLSIEKLRNLNIMLPPVELQQKFVELKAQISKYRLTIQQSLDKLEVLKKALMQEYFG